MPKIIAPILLLLSIGLSANLADAQIFEMRGDNRCSEPNHPITAQGLQSYINATPAINGCAVFKTTFVEKLSSSGIPVGADGYDGPVLFVTVVKTNRDPQILDFKVLAIRADRPLCLVDEGNSITSIYYRMESDLGGIWSLIGSSDNISERTTLKFTQGALSMVDHNTIITTGGLFQSKEQRPFSCGSHLSEADTTPIP
jgi:hypothetical protein